MVRGSAKGDDIGKIFVGGLAPETNEDDLQEYFGQYGLVTDSVVMRDASTNTKRSRGFGFVTFKDPASVEKVISDKPHILGGKTIDPKHAVPRGPGQQGPPPPVRGGGGGGGGGGSEMNKVFVGGLPQNISEDGLVNFFSTFGKVEVKRVEERGRGRGMHMNQRNPLATPVHGGGMPGMYGPPGQYGGGQYPQQGPGPYGQQGPGMGRGFNNPGGYGGYGAPGQPLAPGGAPGYGAAPPSTGYGYAGMPTAGMPAAGYEAGGYGRGAPQVRDAGGAVPYGSTGVENGTGYGASYGAGVPQAGGVPPPVAPTAAGGYEQYSQMPATSSALPTPGVAPPRVEATPGAPDYSAYSSYALGSSYQQQDSQYGPARTSLDSSGGYAGYGVGAGTEAAYSTACAGTGAAAGGFEAGSFGRGGGNVSRGYHPYGR